MAFYVGQKVVCVDDDTAEADGVTRLVNGRVFTIRRIATQFSRPGWVSHPRYKGQGPFVWLTEISGRALGDTPYNASRFRPVVERKTDISALKALLNPSREEVSA